MKKPKNIYKIYEWNEYTDWSIFNELTNKRAAIQEYNMLKNDVSVKLVMEKVFIEVLRENINQYE